MARGLRRFVPPSPPEKALPREGGGSSHSPHSTAELLGLGDCDPALHRAALVPLCSSRREQRSLRQLPDLFLSCLPGARQGFTQMELPAGAWGSTHCSGAVCLVLPALYPAPKALHCSRGSSHCSKGSALLRGSVQCTRGSYTFPRALCNAVELCTKLQGLCALLWSSVHRFQGLCTLSSRSFSKELLVLPRLLPSPVQPLAARSITATSQPLSASPRQPLTACVSGHTSISPGPAGPAPMAFCSCSAWPAPGGPLSPGWGTLRAGAAHPHQQPGPGCVPACHGGVGSSTATGNLLLYIDSFRVVFSIFMGNRGFGLVWFF